MNTRNSDQELRDLIIDAREHLIYLGELGVESVATVLSDINNGEPLSPTTTIPLNDNKLPQEMNRAMEAGLAIQPESFSKPETPGFHTETLFEDLAPPAPTLPKSGETLEEIWADVGNCMRCPLHQERTHIVHTEGNRKARLMFVGEAPGADEDAQARPFVGRAGQLLTKIIEAIGFNRDEVLIGNVNRCRPPGNRPPTSDEAAMCKPFLLREIASVQPDVIVVLGNTAMKNLLDTREGITRLRGKFQEYKGLKIMPTFHPAYLLRDPSKKRETWEDLKKVREYLDEKLRPDSQTSSKPEQTT